MKNFEIFKELEKYMLGGVNSLVRCFKGFEINLFIIKSGKGVIIKDEDDNEYIDFVLVWGLLIFGYCDEDVVKVV